MRYPHITGRLVQAQSLSATLLYTYTADGLRVAQSVNGAETTFAWDWASAVPELLAAGGTRYLPGHETLGWTDGATWRYVLPDALGSVRQVADAAGAVVAVREWTPYGEEIGGLQEGLGYTGEWQDAAVGLVYLRARWYAPGVGRFTSSDPLPGLKTHPLSFHPYLYVLGNPINRTDPSGLQPPFPPPPQPDARDLTDWLVREMQANANSPEVRHIHSLIQASRWLVWIHPVLPSLLWGLAANEWRELVRDGARWDFKDQIKQELRGKTIMLCHVEGCEWFEYSVPGNIHYGYVGRAAGFDLLTLHIGASVAEVTDPAHWEELKAYARTLLVTPEYFNLHLFCRFNLYVHYSWWRTGFDDPTDFAAIELGSALYDRARTCVSLADFQTLLSLYSPQLKHMPAPAEPYLAPEVWPYPLGYFDGGK